MEDVAKQPVEYGSLRRAPDPYWGNERRLATIDLGALRQGVSAQKTEIIKEIWIAALTSEERAAMVRRAEGFFQFVYNVFLVPETQLSDEQKEASARIHETAEPHKVRPFEANTKSYIICNADRHEK